MKLAFIRNLEGTETLAKTLYGHDGKVLLKAGNRITRDYINSFKTHGLYFVYIEDENLEDVTEDTFLSELKEESLTSVPRMFDSFTSGNIREIEHSLFLINDLVDYIAELTFINTNLYEVKSFDNYTYIHSVDTAIMSAYLGAHMGFSRKSLKELTTSAMLHDIGKTKIAPQIINKNGALSNEEFEEMKKHPIYGADILSPCSLLSENIVLGVLHHHEKIDGTGYPFGLSSSAINMYARIITVADVFTAVSANRSYRNRFNPNEAYELILSSAGTSFDCPVVERFKECFSIYPLGCCVRLSNEIEGYVVRQNKGFADRPVIRVIYDPYSKKTIQPFEINLVKYPNIVIDCIVEN